MMSVLSRLALLALSCGSAHAAFGNAWSSGPTGPGNYIIYASATLVVPIAPKPQVGLLSLWTGMGMSNGDLVQALVESYSGDVDEGCGPLNGTWCAWTSVLPFNEDQTGGAQAVAQVGDNVTLTYVYNTTTNSTDQFVLINDVVISTFTSSPGGVGLGFGTAEECQPEYPCGKVAGHHWTNVTVILNTAQPSYSDTFGNGGSTGSLTSYDGGKTWVGPDIYIEPVNFNYPISYPTPTCPTANHTTYTSPDGRNYTILCDTELSGGNLQSINIPANRVADCLAVCEEVDGCSAVVMSGTACYMKSDKHGPAKYGKGLRAAVLQS